MTSVRVCAISTTSASTAASATRPRLGYRPHGTVTRDGHGRPCRLPAGGNDSGRRPVYLSFGQPIVTTDIAGYNCFTNASANREVFMRWTELGALLPVMRLHRGQDEICHHWSFDQDQPTLDHYKKYVVLHTALFPYFYTLSYEAMATGLPVVRHLMLEFPDDRATWKLDYQFLIGDRLLAAPVWKRGATEWSVYLPAGEWVHWWSGKSYAGPARVTVAAPLGEVPLFARAGKIIPMFDNRIDTLVQEDQPELMGWDDANASLKAVFYGRGRDS